MYLSEKVQSQNRSDESKVDKVFNENNIYTHLHIYTFLDCPRAPCDFDIASNNSYSSSCNKCRLSQNKNECRCNCKGKCAYGLSSVPCRCGAGPSCPLDKGYQPVAESSLHDSANNSDSDEEYCECCSCGCEDSDNSTCCCN
ncbi:uncharacterized protein LOC122636185 [Vespula pensylvanica]|uniref:uncharacterized protein LOC122636185 n=1 Tax=Vespula pensylvanica TaxID=30213 RepID=UPI001CB9F42E|nr:uncharacterized protein LOC122636185 [Vespula pensylvanica]